MTCRGKAIVVVMVAVVLLLGSMAGWTRVIIRDGAPNTIGEALSKPDGTTVTLTCEQVLWRGKSGKSFAIKEWYEKSPQRPRLLVVSTKPLPVEQYWSVNIIGTIQTFTVSLPTGATYQQRGIITSPENVQVYCDAKGRIRPVPVSKSMADYWPTTRPIGVSFGGIVGQLPILPDTPDAPLPTPGSRDSIKSLPNGAHVQINGAVVSASFGNQFCIQRSDRSFATWVYYTRPVLAGSLVDISGTMSTDSGMRLVVADNIISNVASQNVYTLDTTYTVPECIGMNNYDVWHDLDSIGLDTSGYGVRVWGKVTQIDSNNHAFYITDGSDTPLPYGVRVKDHTNDNLPGINDIVAVTGGSGIDNDATGYRTVHRYSSDDVSIYTSLALPQSGECTISGTVTAECADGRTIRVYCAKASTTATFSGNQAHYTLNVPYGSHVITASALDCKTTSKPIRINNTTKNPIVDIKMESIGRQIDIITSPSGVLADGTKEVGLAVIVRDEEGRRISNTPVQWNLVNGSVFSSESATNAVGEAKAVIRYSTASFPVAEISAGGISRNCSIAQ